jgi:predicted phage-related endonuclease
MIERIPVTPGSDEWHALRQRDVTASIASALLGAHPYATPNDIYYVKAGILPADSDETPAMKRGRVLEESAIKLLREQKPDWKIEVPGAYYRDAELRIGATPDVFATSDQGRGVVQIKSVEASVFRRNWRFDNEVEPPMYAVIQANVEALMTGASWAAVAALVVGFGIDLHIVQIPLHVGIIDRIKAEVAAFWDRVERREPYPFDYARDGALIAKIFSEATPGKIIDLTGDNALPALAAEDKALGEELKAVKARRGVVRSEIIAKIGDAEGATFQGGRITAKMVHRKSYTVAASTFRDVRIKLIEEAS